MKFKETDRVYLDGDKKGQAVLVPDIKSSDDIPQKVKNFFDDSYKFLEDFVGKENIVYAEVHLDEDTPHMHFYFLPVVNEVRRKVFETDSNGINIKREVIGKDGKTNLVPIQMKDENGKNIYKTEKGKFLNCDQFWKDKGGKTSFAKIQDSYNEYITQKGFNLFRGNKGLNLEHKTTLEKKMDDLKLQLNDMEKEILKNQKLNELELQTNKEIKELNDNDLLNPSKRKLVGYKDSDVENLIEYSKEIKKDNLKVQNDVKKKEIKIEDLSLENDKLYEENKKLKDGSGIKERDTIIEKQKETIKNQKSLIKDKDTIIDNLRWQVNMLSEKLDNFKEKIYKFCDKLCKALAYALNLNYSKDEDINYDDMEYQADKVIRKYEKGHKDKDDFEIGM